MVKAVHQAIQKGHREHAHMTYNHPVRDHHGNKKFKVLAHAHGKTRLIRYGDANMRIKKNSPSHRKSFRARHHCSSCHDKLTARYWSCRNW